MRYLIYGLAILVAMLAAKMTAGHLPRGATASPYETGNAVDVLKLEQTINAKALPRRDLPDEVYR
jgi:hypothetical protein